MSNTRETIYLRGKIYWAKVMEDQLALNYGKDGKEWTLDLSLDKENLAKAKAAGLNIKNKDDEKGDFVHLKQRELRRDYQTGEMVANKPVRIIDAKGNAWNQEERLGNETIGDVKVTVADYGVGKNKGVYLDSIRVLKHKPAPKRDDFPELADDEDWGAPVGGGKVADANQAVFDLDEDDIP